MAEVPSEITLKFSSTKVLSEIVTGASAAHTKDSLPGFVELMVTPVIPVYQFASLT